jgi:hypothetical protein
MIGQPAMCEYSAEEIAGLCSMESAYRNVGYFLLALPLVFVAGFWIPYLSEIPRFEPSITVPVHLDALLLFAWIVLLVVQPLAIRRKMRRSQAIERGVLGGYQLYVAA